MNNRFFYFYFFIFLFFASACTKKVAYLPAHNGNVGTSVYGSFVNLKTKEKQEIEGELLAVQDSNLFVRIHSKKEIYNSNLILKVNYNDVTKMKLRYINQEDNSMYLIPAITITHGFWLILTLPINLVTILTTKKNSEIATTYDKKSIKFEVLYKFSRFPQGLPDNVFVILNK